MFCGVGIPAESNLLRLEVGKYDGHKFQMDPKDPSWHFCSGGCLKKWISI